MSMSDPIADLLTRIRNAQQVGLRHTNAPYSTIKESLLKVLVEEGYLTGYQVMGEGVQRALLIELKYFEGKGVIVFLRRVSRPGLRRYTSAALVPTVKNSMGHVIMTTPKGIMTGANAKRLGVGGEIICEIF